MNVLTDYGIFLLKCVTLIASVLIVVVGVMVISGKTRDKAKDKLRVKSLRDKFRNMTQTLNETILPKKQLKAFHEEQKTKAKALKKALEQDAPIRKRIFVLNFMGDIKASAVRALREEITAILTIAKPTDEIVCCIESGGGTVHGYGLGASQLERIRQRDIPLIVCIDKVAASGGYLMASVANKILASPFAIVGSIGVVAQIPNFNRFLKKHNIDFEQITAGEYKRTLSMFGENTKKGREKFQEEIQEVHDLFKDAIAKHRPQVNLAKVATGEHWLATRAFELNLVDELITSDDYLLKANDTADLFEIKYTTKRSIGEKLATNVSVLVKQLKSSIQNTKEI